MWENYLNRLLPQYEREYEEWYKLLVELYEGNEELWRQMGGQPPKPVEPTVPPKPVYARNPIMCYGGKPECELGWQKFGGTIFWASGKDSAFLGGISGSGTSTCGRENCFEIESRYMTVAYLLPRRVYYKPDSSNFYYSQWCCRCNVAVK